jgi:NTE family protein
MVQNIYNLVFEGGGILGIAYLGVLDYLYQNHMLVHLRRVAGTSSGSIAACITSLNLPFDKMKAAADSLDYRKVPYKEDFQISDFLAEETKNSMELLFGDLNCLYRLITHYGWFSTEYFYQWLQDLIAAEFNDIKQPPYTFADFKDPRLHKDNRPFKDLFIIGTNLTTGASKIFSYDTTPMMEVACAKFYLFPI